MAKKEKKLTIYYTPEVFSKITRLILAFDKEVGWNMVVESCTNGYRITDIFVYPQKQSGAYLAVDEAKYAMWKATIPPEADANLFGQGHSHVMMGVCPSSRDAEQQKDEVLQKGHGFYFFQIWNKKLEVNSFLYDIDNNVMYDADDIRLVIEEDDFIRESKEILANLEGVKE